MVFRPLRKPYYAALLAIFSLRSCNLEQAICAADDPLPAFTPAFLLILEGPVTLNRLACLPLSLIRFVGLYILYLASVGTHVCNVGACYSGLPPLDG
ncbi:hypothetical protein F4778DRAFT_544081 [Xylariomycetidae sp. FL2044]|nr:hypothetical protein F4778DRAFT_544081 [Xylariomycetidae sp. FL2044]